VPAHTLAALAECGEGGWRSRPQLPCGPTGGGGERGGASFPPEELKEAFV